MLGDPCHVRLEWCSLQPSSRVKASEVEIVCDTAEETHFTLTLLMARQMELLRPPIVQVCIFV